MAGRCQVGQSRHHSDVGDCYARFAVDVAGDRRQSRGFSVMGACSGADGERSRWRGLTAQKRLSQVRQR